MTSPYRTGPPRNKTISPFVVSLLSRLGWAGLAASFLLLCTSIVSYIGRWDIIAAASFFPFWTWGIAGLGLAVTGWFFNRAHRSFLVLCLMWATAISFLSDDLSRFLVSFFQAPQSSRKNERLAQLRVVTLNCSGQSAAAGEVASENPDLVLLQESPPEDAVARLAKELYGGHGGYLYGFDCSIISRGPVYPLPAPKGAHFTRAGVHVQGGREIEVASIRLSPPEIRFDLWDPACWTAHYIDRLGRREQLAELLTEHNRSDDGRLRIVGGDFNVPGGDGILRMIEPAMKDSFREAGAGWGNSAINDLPVSRPDQIWISKSCRARAVRTKQSSFSDHRMVITDLDLE